MVKTSRFDPSEYLTDRRDQAELLKDALASGDEAYLEHAVAVVARAQMRKDQPSTTKIVSFAEAVKHQGALMRLAA
ncbi:MAG: DNA-binding protein [Allosphingosinicella sp.]